MIKGVVIGLTVLYWININTAVYFACKCVADIISNVCKA